MLSSDHETRRGSLNRCHRATPNRFRTSAKPIPHVIGAARRFPTLLRPLVISPYPWLFSYPYTYPTPGDFLPSHSKYNTSSCMNRVSHMAGKSATQIPKTSLTTSTLLPKNRDGNPPPARTPRSSRYTWRSTTAAPLTVTLRVAAVAALLRAKSALAIF
ncbi:peptidyl-prolyl cis-trans isomerase ssp-1 [Histoplasma capsulatum G186AR]|uniref:Peptidyl-prolyl cis-trans isomerase ssp-1 n=1 Tax=Ajellomyces capsulatus TaxID=5037 RepID=A0A8H8D931_AJECA|nr:peptidyl-prolyl cis-trans isomerase ssp-1 [Histoplasma capsulatum]QSS69772.1 peptidyl-prolyl cis-trans isomerase ssp-1 [Histoplasma capsulatum G186AR]